jgi:DJ-1/PfpI family
MRTKVTLAIGLCVAFLAILSELHVLEPEFNPPHLISEYQLGPFGWLMALAFFYLGAALAQGAGRDLQLFRANRPARCRPFDNGSPARGLCGRPHPGGAKSPALLAEDPRVTKFVQDVSARGGVIACICRGSMLAARSEVVAGRRMTGFNDSASYPELVVQPDAEAAGATWVQDAPVVVDRNLVTSPQSWRRCVANDGAGRCASFGYGGNSTSCDRRPAREVSVAATWRDAVAARGRRFQTGGRRPGGRIKALIRSQAARFRPVAPMPMVVWRQCRTEAGR